jgi:hypothetical protein
MEIEREPWDWDHPPTPIPFPAEPWRAIFLAGRFENVKPMDSDQTTGKR